MAKYNWTIDTLIERLRLIEKLLTIETKPERLKLLNEDYNNLIKHIEDYFDYRPFESMKLLESYEKEKGAKMVTKVIKFAIEEYNSFINARADINSTEIDEELEIIEA